METPRTRRVQRVHLGQPLVARLGSTGVVLVDVSILGARVEHHVPLAAGAFTRLTFDWDGRPLVLDCRIVRSRLERFSVGADGLTVYHSGLEFENVAPDARARLKEMIGGFISRALEEQKLNARGVLPQHDAAKMPIFRFGGQLTANAKDKELGAPLLPTSRVAKETGYVCYALDNNQWRRKRTHDPGQPAIGFTISADEDHTQAELLCDAYRRSDPEGRRLIQLFAQMSIVEGEGTVAGRFDP
ncbi:MAG TPA: PilZ domain-containing protein [Thermoanaerobaculia bacterium]